MRLLLFFLTMLLTICIPLCNVYDGSQLYDRFYFIKIDTFENGTTREKIPKQNTPNIRDYLLFDIENNIVRGYFVFNKIDSTENNHSYVFYFAKNKPIYMKLLTGEDCHDFKVFDTILYKQDLQNDVGNLKRQINNYENRWPPSDYRDTSLRMYNTALRKVNLELSNPLIKESWVLENYAKLFTKKIEQNVETNFLKDTDIVASKIVYKSSDTYDIFIYAYLSGSKNSYYQLSFKNDRVVYISEYINGKLIDNLTFRCASN